MLFWDHHFKEFYYLSILLGGVKLSAILLDPLVVLSHAISALCIMQASGGLQNNFTTIGRGVCM